MQVGSAPRNGVHAPSSSDKNAGGDGDANADSDGDTAPLLRSNGRHVDDGPGFARLRDSANEDADTPAP